MPICQFLGFNDNMSKKFGGKTPTICVINFIVSKRRSVVHGSPYTLEVSKAFSEKLKF